MICFKFTEDKKSLRQYYLSKFHLVSPVNNAISRRHVRYLMSNGHWQPQSSRYTNTAKWTKVDKFRRDIKSKFNRLMPVKIYWSLSEMTGPLDEFRGKGYPINRILAAFDIDGSHQGDHEITDSLICELCLQDAKMKLGIVVEKLENMGYGGQFSIYSSGAKGFHIYLMDPKNPELFMLMSRIQMQRLVEKLLPFVDSFLSKKTGEFDMHRIFKVPETIDASTGRKVSQNDEGIEFVDKLVPLE